MIPKEIKYNLHYNNVRGDFYGRYTAQHQPCDGRKTSPNTAL